MNEVKLSMKLLEDKIVSWAQTRQDIRAVIVIGSQARLEHPADEWSDLDIELLLDEVIAAADTGMARARSQRLGL